MKERNGSSHAGVSARQIAATVLVRVWDDPSVADLGRGRPGPTGPARFVRETMLLAEALVELPIERLLGFEEGAVDREAMAQQRANTPAAGVAQRPEEVEERVEIPRDAVPWYLGQDGARIKAFREAHKVRGRIEDVTPIPTDGTRKSHGRHGRRL